MRQVYHEAVCQYEVGDIVKVKGYCGTFEIEEIALIQLVKANTMQFQFLIEGEWIPYSAMGEIVKENEK